MIVNGLHGQPLPVYGEGANVRDWLNVTDHCPALLLALEKGRSGETYNIGGGAELPNIEIVKRILGLLDKSENLIHYVKDRPGHDRRSAIDPPSAQPELGRAPALD